MPVHLVSCLLVEDLVAYLVLEQMAFYPQYQVVPVRLVSFAFWLRTWLHTWFWSRWLFYPQYQVVPVRLVSCLLVEDLVAYLVLEQMAFFILSTRLCRYAWFLAFWLRTWLHIWFWSRWLFYPQYQVVPVRLVSCLLVEDLVAYLVLEQMGFYPQYQVVPVRLVSLPSG